MAVAPINQQRLNTYSVFFHPEPGEWVYKKQLFWSDTNGNHEGHGLRKEIKICLNLRKSVSENSFWDLSYTLINTEETV